MKVSEFKRWLAAQGCTFAEATRHTIVRLGKRRSVLPRHSSAEIAVGTMRAILKDLGLSLRKEE